MWDEHHPISKPSATASTALSEKVLAGGAAAIKRYFAVLSAGASKYAIDLLTHAGVGMTTAGPLARTMTKLNPIRDEIEAILKQMETSAWPVAIADAAEVARRA